MRGLLEPKDESLEIEQVVLVLLLVLEKSRYLSVARNIINGHRISEVVLDISP